MKGAKDVQWCRDHSLGPSVTDCLALGLVKIGLHHRQSTVVSVGWSIGIETSLSTAITDPQRVWDQTAAKSRALSPHDWLATGICGSLPGNPCCSKP